MPSKRPADATPQEWRKHLHRLRYERRLSAQRYQAIGLLLLAIGLLLAGFAIAGRMQ